MLLESKEPLRTGRYNLALALVKDRFVFAMGGMVGKN